MADYINVSIGGYKCLLNPESMVIHGPNDIIEERLSGRGAFQLFFGGKMADIITFDGWVTSADFYALMALREKKRQITVRANMFAQVYPTTAAVYCFIEDVLFNEQRAITGYYPYKFRLRKIGDADNYNRCTITQLTNEVSTFAITPKPVMVYPVLDGSLSFTSASSMYTTKDSSTSASLDITTNLTLEAWVNPTTLPAAATVVSKNTGAGDYNYILYLNNSGNIVFKYTVSGPTSYTYTATGVNITTGTRQNIIVSYTFGTPASIAVYVNGVLSTGSWDSTPSAAVPLTTAKRVRIGGDGAGSNYFNGKINDVAIQSVVTTAAQAIINYYYGTPPITTTTVGYWQLNEWVGSLNNDASGNGNTLTMTNSPTFAPGSTGATPSQLPTGIRAGENGSIPYIKNYNNNIINYGTLDYDADYNTIVTGMANGEYYIKNGLMKIVTRITHAVGDAPGGIDLYYWNGSAYTYVGYFYHGVYSSSWQYTYTQPCTPTILVADDTEYALVQVIWNGFSDGTTIMAEYEVFKGKPYVSCRLSNIGTPDILGVSTEIANSGLTTNNILGCNGTQYNSSGGNQLVAASTDVNNFAYISNNATLGSGVIVAYVLASTKANGRYYKGTATSGASYWPSFGQLYTNGTMQSVSTGNLLERFWVGAKVMQTAAAGDDDPIELGKEVLATVDTVLDIVKVT